MSTKGNVSFHSLGLQLSQSVEIQLQETKLPLAKINATLYLSFHCSFGPLFFFLHPSIQFTERVTLDLPRIKTILEQERVVSSSPLPVHD